MGEIADDMTGGQCCSVCMTYYKKPHGYPVLCDYCWKEASKDERKDYQEALNEGL